MARPKKYNNDGIILCACGCGNEVKKARYPSRQAKYINTHQHRGKHNGNYRGGKEKRACSVCGKTFYRWPSQVGATCGSPSCYSEWQRLITSARGIHKIKVNCAYCDNELRLFPSQVKERNYCNKYCLAKNNPKAGSSNGNWRGGKDKYYRSQALIRDNYRCVICGFDIFVQVHHITPRAENGSDNVTNLITLCPNHHYLADLGIINVEHLRNTEWQPEATAD